MPFKSGLFDGADFVVWELFPINKFVGDERIWNGDFWVNDGYDVSVVIIEDVKDVTNAFCDLIKKRSGQRI